VIGPLLATAVAIASPAPTPSVVPMSFAATLKLASTSVVGHAAPRGSLAVPANECAGYPRGTETVDVGGVKATYASGAEIVPHLYWRSGRVVYTVSGPFPAATLGEVARSLEPVGG
jgi:hypothetical protein